MNKAELASAIADKAGISTAQASAALTALTEAVTDAGSKGEKVQIPGFLTIERTERAARTGRNPQTGESMEIPAGYAVKATAGATLKAAVKK